MLKWQQQGGISGSEKGLYGARWCYRDKRNKEVAERTGLEPATPGVTGRYSNQLNYRSAAVVGVERIELPTSTL